MKIDEALGEHATLFKDHYYIRTPGNCDLSRMSDPHNEFKGKNVLIELVDTPDLASKYGMPLAKYLDILGECRHELFNVRTRRPRPLLDDKVLPPINLSFHRKAQKNAAFCQSCLAYLIQAWYYVGDRIMEWTCNFRFC